MILTFFIILSGAVDYAQRSYFASPYLYQIFGQNEFSAANWIEKNVPQNVNILTGTTHINLVNCLAGRPVVEGYPGWLWSHVSPAAPFFLGAAGALVSALLLTMIR